MPLLPGGATIVREPLSQVQGGRQPQQQLQMACRSVATPLALPPSVPELEVKNGSACRESIEGYRTDEDSDDAGSDPRQSGLCHRLEVLISSESWGVLVMAVIFANTLVMAIECDYDWTVWDTLEDLFLAFFTVELALRLAVYRGSFFTDEDERGWNIFDFVIVLSGILENMLIAFYTMKGAGGNKTEEKEFTVLRIMRIVRVFRACRVIRHFKQLHLLMNGFFNSMQAVTWIAVLFVAVVFVAGIICTTVIGQHAQDWGPPHGTVEEEKQIDLMFGTLERSMITMFQMVTLDDWADICGLVGERRPSMIVFLIAYTLLTAFAMIALLTGVMTEHITSVSAEADRQEKERLFAEYVDTLEFGFRGRSSNGGDDGLTVEEFSELLASPEVSEGIRLGPQDGACSSEELTEIFRSLDVSGDGRVSWDEFKTGLKYVQGHATARQVSLLRADVRQMMNTLKGVVGGPAASSKLDGMGVSAVVDAGTNSARLSRLEQQLQNLQGRLTKASQASSAPQAARVTTPSGRLA
mmetsp:Transcript_48361/g.144400  ORF Transcript_48361/g.144400 Transcript_48361/m.144400 type:complete len:525 (+) Transcript_48361:85-1659(+)